MNKILIVEDEEALSLALKDNFLAEGYTVDTATDGEMAMEHIAKSKPSIILLDLLMPKKDGFYVLQEVRKDAELKTIPIIVLSNIGGDGRLLNAASGLDISKIAMFADDYLIKSQHSIDEIVAKVREFMDGKKAAKVTPVVG
jgi:DNA-binding response OmpR family regulator